MIVTVMGMTTMMVFTRIAPKPNWIASIGPQVIMLVFCNVSAKLLFRHL